MNSAPGKEGTVCFLLKDDTVFLILQEYPSGKRVWSGFGGMKEADESYEDCVAREGTEELRFSVEKQSLQKVAIIQETSNFTLHVFLADNWQGNPVICENTIKAMRWFKKNDLPYNDMWLDNKFWLPKVLRGKHLTAIVHKDIYHTDEFSENDIVITEQVHLPQ